MGAWLLRARKVRWINIFLTVASVVIGLSSCQPSQSEAMESIALPVHVDLQNVQAFVETPVGSFHRIAYDLKSERFDTISQTILPLPINAGFVLMEQDSQVEKINTWIFGQGLTTGDVLSINPIAMVNYELEGNHFNEIVAVPQDSSHSIIDVKRLRDLMIGYDPVKFNFEYWLRHSQDIGSLSALSWEDEVKVRAYLAARLAD